MTTESLKTIVDSCAGHVRDALQAYASLAENDNTPDYRKRLRAHIEGYLLAAKNSGNLLIEHHARLCDEIKTTDGYRLIGACFEPKKPLTTAGERSLYRWQYKLCGGFESALWITIERADSANLAALERAFPEHVAAFRRYANEAGYWDDLCNRINGGE
jgi:hypothetical protein